MHGDMCMWCGKLYHRNTSTEVSYRQRQHSYRYSTWGNEMYNLLRGRAWLRGRGVAELIHDDTAQVHQLKELVCTVHQPFVNKLSGNTNGMISQRPHLSVAKNVG